MDPIPGLRLEFVPLRAGPPEFPEPEARGFLCPEEEAAYRAFSSPKRRRDWLAGRLAAKLALAKELEANGARRPLNEIAIGNDLEGAPVWRALRGTASAWPISITHSGGLAAAAVHTRAARLGFDLEKVEERHEAWLEIAFHPEERAAASTPESATRMWTLKEAVLKALGLGLRADLWDVRCSGGGVRLLGRALQRHAAIGSPELRCSSRDLENGHVMTVAYTEGTPEDQRRAAQKGDFAWSR